MAQRTIRDVAALAIINADEKVSLDQARRLVAKHLPVLSA